VSSVNLVKTTDNCHGTDTDAIGWAGDSKKPDDVPSALEKYIAFGNLWCENRFDEFHYPAGGSPKKTEILEEYAYSPTIVLAPKK
jgi:hypothetical protein